MPARSALLITVAAVAAHCTLYGVAAAQSPRALSEPSIIPRPASLRVTGGRFVLGEISRIHAEPHDPDAVRVAAYLAAELASMTGLKLSIVREAPPTDAVGAIHVAVAKIPVGRALHEQVTIPEGAYSLVVTPARVSLLADNAAGLLHACQSLRQLLTTDDGAWVAPCCTIDDSPRYAWRGMLLDCGRHFVPVAQVKRMIDQLAYHKMNVLHWHLTEDQGWRLEVRSRPRLAELSAWRAATRASEHPRDAQGRYGGFYSHEQVREIVAYAAARGISIVPEIEMPGHSRAALAAYPELSCTGGPHEVETRWGVIDDVYCAGNDETFVFLEAVLGEVCELFPSPYVHIGGDECPKTRWKSCAKCQARIKAEGLKDEHELQSYFIRRIEKFLSGKGKRIIGWDEILEGGLAPNATVQSWRGFDGAIAAAGAGHDVISSPTSHCYLDYAQGRGVGEPVQMGFIPLEKVYQFEPAPPQLTPAQAKHVLGGEGNLWTEHAPPELLERQAFPRLCAIAEVLWSPVPRDYADFQRRLAVHYRRLDAMDVRYYIPPPEFTARSTTFTDSVEVTIEPAQLGDVYYTLDGSEPSPTSTRYEQPIALRESAMLRARTIRRTGNASPIAEMKFEKSPATRPATSAAPGS